MDWNTLLDTLQSLDAEMVSIAYSDFDRLSILLEKRATLVNNLAAQIRSLPADTPNPSIRLRHLQESGSSALRQILMAKHTLAAEMAKLKQEQRLWDTVSGQLRTPHCQIDLEG